MSPPRADPLDIIYEDDETDEGAISPDGGTSLHGHPDHEHEHTDEDIRVLATENALLHENIAALMREVACADAEMMRWRSRCRKIEDERDALSRELDRCKAELERRHARPQSMVVYSTAENGPRSERPQSPLYRSVSDSRPSPPPRFSSPRTHALPAGAAQPYSRNPLPAISISPSREPTPPTTGVPTHRGRLAPPRTRPRTSQKNGVQIRPQNIWAQTEQLQEREQRRSSRERSQDSAKAERDREQSRRELEQSQQDWEHIQFSRELEQNRRSPVVYSTGASDEWSYFDISPQKDGWPAPRSPPTVHSQQPTSSARESFLYSSAYPHPNGHGQSRHEQDESLRKYMGRQDLSRGTSHAEAQTQSRAVTPQGPPAQIHPRTDDTMGITPTYPSAPPSSASSSSTGSHEALQPETMPRTPPDPVAAPVPFRLSPTSAAFSPTGRVFSPVESTPLSPTSPPFLPQMPVVDPEFGPVIVHGLLPPRHTQAPNQHVYAPPPAHRRKREPAIVPPRHLTNGKSSNIPSPFSSGAFGGAVLGMPW